MHRASKISDSEKWSLSLRHCSLFVNWKHCGLDWKGCGTFQVMTCLVQNIVNLWYFCLLFNDGYFSIYFCILATLFTAFVGRHGVIELNTKVFWMLTLMCKYINNISSQGLRLTQFQFISTNLPDTSNLMLSVLKTLDSNLWVFDESNAQTYTRQRIYFLHKRLHILNQTRTSTLLKGCKSHITKNLCLSLIIIEPSVHLYLWWYRDNYYEIVVPFKEFEDQKSCGVSFFI